MMKRVGQIFREVLVNRIKNGFNKSSNVFMLTYTNLPATKISEIRKTLKKNGAEIYLSKNAIAALALKEMGHEKLAERVAGQTLFIWGDIDSAEVSKLLVNYAKDIETIQVQGGLVEGRVLNSGEVVKLSELPPRTVLLSQLLGTLQAPLTRLAGALTAKHRDLLSILKQLSEKKGGN
jgi:large subunit ribosomal protein L10